MEYFLDDTGEWGPSGVRDAGVHSGPLEAKGPDGGDLTVR
jgi:hypothetical protein